MLLDALGHTEMMGHYWTLETELEFYVLCLGLFWPGQHIGHKARRAGTAIRH
jgi:peptidoglycan/LPS O-acetylase OafA/YrhL